LKQIHEEKMAEGKNNSLIHHPTGVIEKAEPGTKRVLSGMVAGTSARAKNEPFCKARPSK